MEARNGAITRVLESGDQSSICRLYDEEAIVPLAELMSGLRSHDDGLDPRTVLVNRFPSTLALYQSFSGRPTLVYRSRFAKHFGQVLCRRVALNARQRSVIRAHLLLSVSRGHSNFTLPPLFAIRN
jgi:hypothetical protein